MSDPKSVAKSTPHASDLGFPVFSPGQMLQHDDLTALADYTRNVTRLMLRSLFGCGVACGLCVDAQWKCNRLTVTVQPGVALSCCGDPIHVVDTVCIPVDAECDFSAFPAELWVLLRGLRKCCMPRPATCGADDDEVKNVCTREKYYYEVQLSASRPDCACGCKRAVDLTPEEKKRETLTRSTSGVFSTMRNPCYRDHYYGKCACGCSGCEDCECEWILLGVITKPGQPEDEWVVDYDVRRYVRPMIAPDSQCLPERGVDNSSGS